MRDKQTTNEIGSETMTTQQRTKLNRFDRSISLQKRVLANLETMALVDNGSTVELTHRIIRQIEAERDSFIRRNGLAV